MAEEEEEAKEVITRIEEISSHIIAKILCASWLIKN